DVLPGSGDIIEGNFIGTDPTGTIALGGSLGIGAFPNLTTGLTIGGTTPQARNVISGTTDTGVDLETGPNTVVEGNFIGTDHTGTVPLGNSARGVLLGGRQTIGGTVPGAANVISANGIGVEIDGALIPTQAVVEGNFIGTDPTGTKAVGNIHEGILIQNGASSNLIGQELNGAGNTIAFNGGAGVAVT